MQKNQLIYDVHEKPSLSKWILLSLQHVLAMFGATVLVPALTGLDVGITLIGAGIGTLIYILVTKGRSPVFLGSSFAYITPILSALILGVSLDADSRKIFLEGDYSFDDKLSRIGLTIADLNFMAVSIGLMAVGLVYVLVAIIVKFAGTNWLHKILPPIVIGPIIVVIGLILSLIAVGMARGDGDGAWEPLFVAFITLFTAILTSVYAKGIFKIIPIMTGIIAGYLTALAVGLVDFTVVQEADWFAVPSFVWFREGAYEVFEWSQVVSILSIMIPVALVTISEHIGDHLVLSQIIGRDLTKDPGLSRTLAGDGLATMASGFLGGPANTTYGENTGVVGITKVASVWVIGTAAVFALFLGFVGKFTALIVTIPASVMGGVSIMLFGVIASNGVRVLLNNKVDIAKERNLVIAAVILVLGIGNLGITIGNFEFKAMAVAAIVGIILHQILPDKQAGYGNKLEK